MPDEFVFHFANDDDRQRTGDWLQLFPSHEQRAQLLASLGPHEFLNVYPGVSRGEGLAATRTE
jgi:hypothetical protein